MTEPDRLRVRALFAEAADLPPHERGAFLDAACRGEPDLRAEIEGLLAYASGFGTGMDEDGFLKSPLVHAPERTPSEPPLPQGAGPGPSAHIGRYRILRRHGEGGMGTVYEAEQANPRRTVALKVLRPGLVSPELLSRFRHEAQILGRLQHPGIAQVYEAGMGEDGQPFFAMEFVRGMPLGDYAGVRGLDAAARLELMARVCDAVQHAHDKGVIHRDLKPGNILVDESGQPKVLDFGVAHVTAAELLTTSFGAEAVGEVEFSRSGDQDMCEVFVDPPVAKLVGIGESAASDDTAKTGVVKFLVEGVKTDLDVPQALAISQLGEGHAEELIETGEAANPSIAVVASDATVELVSGQRVDQLREDVAIVEHERSPDALWRMRNGSRLLESSDRKQ